jgi:mediator of RNA polymerase II transcription subunit 6
MSKTSCFIDVHWLQHFGLSKDTVMEYFYTSPFFDSTSNNSIIRQQGMHLDHLRNMKGLEFIVDDDIKEEPILLVIRKQIRNTSTSVDLLEIFYVLDGTIYQSPDFLEIMKSRFVKLSHYLKKSYEFINARADYTPEVGHHIQYNDSVSKLCKPQNLNVIEVPDFTLFENDLDNFIENMIVKVSVDEMNQDENNISML